MAATPTVEIVCDYFIGRIQTNPHAHTTPGKGTRLNMCLLSKITPTENGGKPSKPE